MKICLDFVEYDGNYATVTDAYGAIHYIDDHLIIDTLTDQMVRKEIDTGDTVEFDLPQEYIEKNGIIE